MRSDKCDASMRRVNRGGATGHALALSLSVLVLLLGVVGAASADPIKSPRVSFGTIVCGSTTYQVVSPDTAVTGSVITANDVESNSQVMLIQDKAAAFPQNLLTLCTAFPPPPDQPFQAYFFITPAS
jgi:hypothetical protein